MKNNYLILGMAFLSLGAYAQQERASLIETFTSSTCPPCNPGNVNLEGLLDDSQNDGKAVSIKYQMSWPSPGDPYFTDEADVRRGVYNVGGVPNTRLDGTTDLSTGSMNQTDLNNAYAVASKADIDAYYSVDEAAKTITVEAWVTVSVNTPPGVRVYAGVFEYLTDNNVMTNGETEFEHVMKKMLPDASGTVMPPMTAGETYHFSETYTFQGNYVLPPNAGSPTDHTTEHSIEEFSDLGVAVWVQQLSTREVYQAQYAKVGSAGMHEISSSIASAKIYPNPANEEALVAFQVVEQQKEVGIEVINMLGEVVYSTALNNVPSGRTTHSFATSELTSGVYTVRINAGNGVVSKRLTVSH